MLLPSIDVFTCVCTFFKISQTLRKLLIHHHVLNLYYLLILNCANSYSTECWGEETTKPELQGISILHESQKCGILLHACCENLRRKLWDANPSRGNEWVSKAMRTWSSTAEYQSVKTGHQHSEHQSRRETFTLILLVLFFFLLEVILHACRRNNPTFLKAAVINQYKTFNSIDSVDTVVSSHK